MEQKNRGQKQDSWKHKDLAYFRGDIIINREEMEKQTVLGKLHVEKKRPNASYFKIKGQMDYRRL